MCSSVVPVLQQHVKNLKQQNELLFQRCQEKEQYGRRLSVKITDISSQKNESTEDVRNSVKSIIEESGCDILDIVLEDTHRIGKNDPSGKRLRSAIVRFTTFRHRTIFCLARKNLCKIGVHLDLTKGRFTLYQKARGLVKMKKFVKCVKLEYKKESFFSSISELFDLTDHENNPGILQHQAEGTNVGENL